MAGLATSSITTIELQRAAQRARADDREGVADDATIAVLLAAVAQIPLSALVRQTAATLHPVELRNWTRSISRRHSRSATTSRVWSRTTSAWRPPRTHSGYRSRLQPESHKERRPGRLVSAPGRRESA